MYSDYLAIADTEIAVSNKDASSNLIAIAADLYDNDPATTGPKIVSISKEDVSSNLNVAADDNDDDDIDNLNLNVAADDDDNDDIDSAKSPLIGDLDGIKDEYYQVKGNNNEGETNV